MGKDYWYWAGSKSSKRGGGGAETEIPSGCMCAVFQAFDFHPFHFSINQQQQPSFKSASSIPQDLQSVPKGAEAPRNGLESEGGTESSSKEENLKIPKSIRIKTCGSTRGRAANLNDLSCSSPGTKTPTLVARLMGLDLLPDANSSSSSSSSCLSTPNQQGHPHVHHHLRPRQHIQRMKHRNSTGSDNNAAIRSLPETPRMSSARRSDVEHRLSLQINKENMGLGEDLELPRFSFSKRKYDENSYSRTPTHCARQIVKEVGESVSRKVGLDITNTVKSRDQLGREEFVGQIRFKKSPKTSVKSIDESSPGKHSNPSYSPRLSRFMDTKHKLSTKPASPLNPKDQNTHPKPASPPRVVNVEAQLSRVLTKAKPQALPEHELQNQKPVPKCMKTSNEKFSSRLNKPPQTSSIRNKQEESFIIRPQSPARANDVKSKSKITHPLPTNLLNNLNTVLNLLPVKTDPSPPATKIPQKQVSDAREPKGSAQLSSRSRQRYKQEATHILAIQGTNDEDKCKGGSTTTRADDEGPEFQYITAILSRTGVHKATVLEPHLHFQWFSPFHPLDPSIFHRLEHYPPSNSSISSLDNDKEGIFTQKNQLGPSCNRRLLFDLVDEVLSEILVRPKYCYRGMLLLETVWKRVRSFPRAKCEVLEDIDGLIEMEEMKVEEEEGEGLVVEIERNILETLVHETVTVMVSGVCWVRN